MLKSDCPAAVERLFPVFFETATEKAKWCYHETIFEAVVSPLWFAFFVCIPG
jgi:hypothetical protein